MAPLAQFERTLDPLVPAQAAFMMAVRRAGAPAAYAPFEAGSTPWHAAMAATYAHATAPLRRLADRYVLLAVLAVANGRSVPGAVTEAFGRRPDVMARAANTASQIERAVIDLAETTLLQGREGEAFAAIVIEVDARGARIQLRDLPIVARVATPHAQPGQVLSVTLREANPDHPPATFQLTS